MSLDPTRRTVLKTLASAAAAVPAAAASEPIQDAPHAIDSRLLRAIADAVLPEELGAGRAEVANRFVRWASAYREGADMDHGYGVTRIRRTGPSPARGYAAQLAALGRAAAARKPGATFADLGVEDRRTLIAEAFADAKIERLPGRPSGAHIAADLMAFYFNSPEAQDLCYRAQIGRDTCRGLPGSERPPAPLAVRPTRGRR